MNRRAVGRVAITCAQCGTSFTLARHAYERRVARYGARLLCQRCLGDIWLDTWRGARAAEELLCAASAAEESGSPALRARERP